jgi:hypothetical protein
VLPVQFIGSMGTAEKKPSLKFSGETFININSTLTCIEGPHLATELLETESQVNCFPK